MIRTAQNLRVIRASGRTPFFVRDPVARDRVLTVENAARSGDIVRMSTDAERIAELEIKISYLEKHVEGQDRAMMDMTRQLDRLQRGFDRLSETVKNLGGDSGVNGSGSSADERPPHY